MSDRLKLADELEMAEGPNFDLEMRIFRAVNPQATSRSVPPNYTASLDAAMTLVPEDCDWLRKDFRTMTVVRSAADLKMWGTHFDATGATPALALCAAALRAEGE